jgi:BirA family transcriptional regulator, biotin operon repressor / biotin---[acetyl-CoA-carboxylase] ligase
MPFCAAVHRFDSVTSTNDVARALALEGAAHGTAVLAREQTQGRGTKGRAWHSPAGLGLYASFILRGPDGGLVPSPHLLPLAAGLAVSVAILEAAGVETRLKWPNDILFEGRKLGGILCEGAGAGAAGGFVVAGLGLNVGHAAADFPAELRGTATSLSQAAGRVVSFAPLWEALCRALERWYNVFARGDKEAIVGSFGSRSAFSPGEAVRVETAGGAFGAAYEGLDTEGRLVVRRENGGERAVLDAVLRLDPVR